MFFFSLSFLLYSGFYFPIFSLNRASYLYNTFDTVLFVITIEMIICNLIFIEPFNFSFFSITGQGIDLDYCDIEWFALEMNRDHSVIFETASKYCISDSFVDYVGYSISSKGFLPRVVYVMVI